MANTYHGEYKTVESCQKLWISRGQNDLRFPAQVNYPCNSCNTTHNFRLNRTYTIATPNQTKQFDEYCKRQNIEQDVAITE